MTAGAPFSALTLNPAVLANLAQLGYLSMTPIQQMSLPAALAGKDLIAQAKTGSGKTAAFALALLAKLNPRWFAVQAMVLCPTRELADQVTQELRRLAARTRLSLVQRYMRVVDAVSGSGATHALTSRHAQKPWKARDLNAAGRGVACSD